jgi:hypothetical protein
LDRTARDISVWVEVITTVGLAERAGLSKRDVKRDVYF